MHNQEDTKFVVKKDDYVEWLAALYERKYSLLYKLDGRHITNPSNK